MKTAINLAAFFALVIGPLVFFIGEAGLAFRQNGGSWLPFVLAPVQAAIFAFIVSGKPGKKVAGIDDQGGLLVSRFWGVFGLLTVALEIFAFILSKEA